MSDYLEPGARVGILGGGQLGRMLAMAAARLGLDAVIFAPEHDSPASRVAAETIVAEYDDLDAVARFAGSVSAVTYEFENVPVATAEAAAAEAPVRPGPKALEVAQDRLVEKTFLNDHAAPTVAFENAESAAEARAAFETLGGPAILKTRRFGYDGKGQAVVRSAEEAGAAFDEIGGHPAILEAFADFRREISIVAARDVEGHVAAYPVSENLHGEGILRECAAPARADAAVVAEAERIAATLLEALDYVGVIAVELFELDDGKLLVNEIAPRVHNTGHWTMDACACSQFEQHIRAVAGWGLGDPAPHSAARMINLIGDEANAWKRWLAHDDAVLHLYGKRGVRPGRKMGHVNILSRLP
ncbi:5-(carboxyamino)imidazole ribonucleotide synthase [Marinicauda salina]|uniref:N5-carboxyaminoimidazole ribonucleotide synthase n=1 Tax=Marinicauda salina TaxID=2135793 RepID=A0A2U2BXB1_9PROT|nr:5-(carboxyamino)imidazole ribonucleotide synthase [Marinicauda salina]PWE18658.1 5-(carboxyamino)imidazole ribonucleotide synthase [Marinicauda salina]